MKDARFAIVGCFALGYNGWEIPRKTLGNIDEEPFFHIIAGKNGATIPDIRSVPSRSYYGLRPVVKL